MSMISSLRLYSLILIHEEISLAGYLRLGCPSCKQIVIWSRGDNASHNDMEIERRCMER